MRATRYASTAVLQVGHLVRLDCGVSFAIRRSQSAGAGDYYDPARRPDSPDVGLYLPRLWGDWCHVHAIEYKAHGGWAPPLITVPTSANLTIYLTNNLPAPVPTSLVIMGQLGGGLGTPSKVASPDHAILGTTWPIAGTPMVPLLRHLLSCLGPVVWIRSSERN